MSVGSRSHPRIVLPSILLIALQGPVTTIESHQRKQSVALGKRIDGVVKSMWSGTAFNYEDGKGFRPSVSGDPLTGMVTAGLSSPSQELWSRREASWILDLESPTPREAAVEPEATAGPGQKPTHHLDGTWQAPNGGHPHTEGWSLLVVDLLTEEPNRYGLTPTVYPQFDRQP